MTTASDADLTRVLDQLRQTGEELRQVFAAERTAIATLDHARLETLAAQKRDLATALADLARRVPAGPAGDVASDPSRPSTLVRDLFAALRVEAHATALLANAATESVRALLGYDLHAGYDRRANRVTRGPSRYLATY